MTAEGKLTREEIWRRIRETSREEYILAEMKRLGFWPSDSPQPTLAESFIEERRQLEEKLREVSRDLARVQDPEAALKLLHKERKEAALKRREETRRRRNAERFERAKRWRLHQQQTIDYLGDTPFQALRQKSLDHARLSAQSLPLIGSAGELAAAMGITLNELRFLAYQRDVSTISHYQRFAIPKKSGGERIISAPMPRLKRAQYWLLVNILDKVTLTDSAHGFVRERNILSNALPHLKQKVVVNFDLENFFPSISQARVKGVYRQLGYSEEVATLCALLSTESPTDSYELDGQRYFVKSGPAALPQGAPSSPALTNILCRRLDKRLRGAAAKLDFAYTRYADDLTFSSASADGLAIKKLMWRVRRIVDSEGLKIHPGKTRVMRAHQRQEVTGVVVNEKPSVCRRELRQFRALLFQIAKDGPQGKHWREGSLFNSIEGYANFVAMIDPGKGKPLQQRVEELRRKYRGATATSAPGALNARAFRAAAAAGQEPRTGWWQAQSRPEPVLELTQEQRNEIKRQQKEAQRAAEEARNPKPRPEATRGERAASSRWGQRPRKSFDGLPIWAWWPAIVLFAILLRSCDKI